MKKILVCGGHPTPALSLVDELLATKEFEIVFVGRKYAIDSERTLSYEYKECQRRNVRFIELHAGKLTRIATRSSLVSLLRFPIGFIGAALIVLFEKPNLIMSFGGYIALPIAVWGKLFSIQVFTHEQTMRAGAANKWIALLSKKIFTAFQNAQSQFPQNKTIWVGNPVRRSVFAQNPLSFTCDELKPLIYVTGGSLGSHSINAHIFNIIDKLVVQFTVVHQLGDIKEYGDYEKAKSLCKKIQLIYPNRYIPLTHVDEKDIGSLYAKSAFIIGRAGANTFFELILLRKPAIFIPLPWSANGEQKTHALFFEENHIGTYFDQKKTSDELYEAVIHMFSHLNSYQSHFKSLPLQFKNDATQKLLHEIRSAL